MNEAAVEAKNIKVRKKVVLFMIVLFFSVRGWWTGINIVKKRM